MNNFLKDELDELKKNYNKYYKYIEEKSDKIKENSLEYIKNNFYFDNILDIDKNNKQDIFKIYFVSGILHKKIKTKAWKDKFNSEFKNIEKEYFDDVFYVHLEYRKIKNIITKLADSLEKTCRDNEDKIKKNKKIIIFAHSFGGILSKTAIKKIPKKYRQNIILVTLATPHKLKYANIDDVTKKLETPEDINKIKMFTFGGVFDVVVPSFYAHTEKSLKKDFKAEHLMFLYSTELINMIFDNVFRNNKRVINKILDNNEKK